MELAGVPAGMRATAALAALLHRYGVAHAERELRIRYAGTADGVLRLTVDRRTAADDLLRAAAEAVRRIEPDEGAGAGGEPPHGAVVEPGRRPSIVPDGPVVWLTGDGFDVSPGHPTGPGGDGDAFARHLGSVLDVLARTGGVGHSVASLPLFGDDELGRLLDGWNDTADPAPAGYVHEQVAAVAARDPDALAVTGGGTRLSFGELDACANRLANHLASIGVGPGDRVGTGLDRTPESLVAQLAVFRLGAAAVLLDSAYPAKRLEFMLADSAAVALVTSSVLAGRFAAPCPVVRYDEDAWRSSPASPPPAGTVTDDTVCHVAYTSGSTGEPKAVLLRHGPLRNTIHVLRGQCGISTGDRGSWLCSPGFGLVEVDCLPLLAAGASVHIPGQDVLASPERLRDWIVAERLTQSLVLTAMAERLWGLPWPADTALRVMRIAGERARSWPPATLPFEVLNVYGSAEATVVATCDLKATAAALGDRRAGRLPPIGRPVANVRAYVLDEDLRPMPVGVAGELYVSGASLSAGYLNRPDAEGAKFLPNPLPTDPYPVLYRSGDVARYWPDGTLEVVGRTDHEVKIRGYRVHLGEVESVLAGLPGVRQCAVLARPAADGDLRLVGYVEPAPGGAPTVSALRRAMERVLPAHMVPSAYVVGDLPTTPNGKIDRAALPEPPRTRPDLDAPHVAPASAAERLLAGLFERELDIDGVGARDSFFELGGDSLRAMRLLDRLRRDHGIAVGMARLYEAPTVAELAALLPAAAPTGPFPLTADQRAQLDAGGDAVDYHEWDRLWLDVDRFRLAWRRLLGRHDALRIVLGRDGLQRVLPPPADDGVVVTDLRSLGAAEAGERLSAIRADASRRPVDPYTWPLHELRLTLLPDERVRIHLSLPGLTVDPASARQLFTELADCYEDPDRPLPPLPTSFAAYCAAPPAASCPAAAVSSAAALSPDAAVPSAASGLAMEAGVWARLVEGADREGLAPRLVVVAAFAAAVGAAAGWERLTVRLRTFERPPGFDGVVGAFARARDVAVVAANPITKSARELDRRLGSAAAGTSAGRPVPTVLATDLLDAVTGPDLAVLGEPVARARRYPEILAEIRMLGGGDAPYLDLYWPQGSPRGQLSGQLQDHLRLIDWFGTGKSGYSNLEEDAGCRTPSPCR